MRDHGDDTGASRPDAAADGSAGDAAGGGDACPMRRCGVDAVCGVADFGCGAPLVCAPCGTTLKIVALDGANHLAVDRAGVRVFVTVGAAGGAHANQVVIVDPVLAIVTGTIAVPGEPDLIAVSEDGARLWISVASDAALRWVDLTAATPVVSPLIVPPAATDGTPTKVRALGAVPGAPHSVAVSLSYDAFSTTSSAGTFVFDDGAVRAAHTPATMDVGPNQLIGGPAGIVFGTFIGALPVALTTIHVTGSSVTEVPHTDPSLATGIATYGSGLIAGAANIAIDVSDPDHPVLRGQLEAPGFSTYPLTGFAPLVPRPGRVFTVGYDALDYSNLQLRWVDVAAHRQITAAMLPGTGHGDVRDLLALPPSRMVMIQQPATVDPPTRIYIITQDLLSTP